MPTSLTTLPLWIWLIFSVLLIALITYIYTQGKWRPTLIAAGITVAAALTIAGIDQWFAYLNIHFIGQFDRLGIPFRKAGPGFSILLDAWPLWLVPMGITAVLLFGIDWFIRSFYPKETSFPQTETTKKTGTANVAQQLQLTVLKKDLQEARERLAETAELAEVQLDKKQILEANLEQLKLMHVREIKTLQEKIEALTLDLQSADEKQQQLLETNLEQTAKIQDLQTQLEKK